MIAQTEREAILRTEALAVHDAVGRIPLREIQTNPLYRDREWLTQGWTVRRLAVKRAIDVTLSTLLLLVVLPCFPVIALLIKLDSRGPVIYSQMRIGKDGTRFRLHKFRSMGQGAERAGAYAQTNDPRVTRVGRVLRRTRLDEIPQLWNVLRGDMSLIGPRPELPVNEQMLENGIPGFSMRTVVKPGVTGWAQICAPYANTIEQSGTKLEYDIFYIRQASLLLDLRIVGRTALVMLKLVGQ